MDKVARYLESIPPGLLASALIFCVAAYYLMPLRFRLPVMVAGTCFWFSVSICPQLGVIKDLFKILLPVILAMLVFTAYRDPGERRALPFVCMLYPVMAVAQFLYVLTTINRFDSMAYCMQWLLLVLASMRIVESITSWQRLRLIVVSLGIGLTLGSLFALSSFHAREFSLASGRYYPYGAHPNHIAASFIFSAVLCLLYSQQARKTRTKITMMALGAIGLSQLLMTISRTSIVSALPPLGVLFLHYFKRPAHMVLVAFVLSGVLMYGLSVTSKFNYQRLKSLNTGRTQIFGNYYDEVEARPFTGLMFSRNRAMFSAGDETQHAHNSYLYILYIGGLSYALPLYFLVASSLFSALHVWMYQGHLKHRLFPILCMLMVTCYLIGLTVAELYKPVSVLSFLHLLLSMLLISIAMDRERMTMLRHPGASAKG
jgi:hypothetical protein